MAPIYTVKRLFVQRRAAKGATSEAVAKIDGPALAAKLEARMGEKLTELSYAQHVAHWLNNEAQYAGQLEDAAQYAAWATHSAAGRKLHGGGVLFKVPHRLDMNHLVPVRTIVRDGVTMLHLPEEHHRHREGFGLTDAGMDMIGALDQANYCIWCHNQGKDSCSHGPERQEDRRVPEHAIRRNPRRLPARRENLRDEFGEGARQLIGAMAIATIDNPMCAGTGHRICNDCMKACIYQKQEPVDIPQVETRTLKDVLALPWGFEIYSLLTRWNPLESAPAHSEARQRLQGAGRRPRPGRLYACRII